MACKEGREEMSDVFSGAPENCDAAAEEDTKGSGGARAAVVGSRTMLSLSVGFFSPSDVGREAACTASESDSSRRRRRCRSDSPEIEIATFPFFSLSLSLYHVPRSLLRPQKLSHLLPSVAASSDKRGKEKRRLVSLTSFAGESLERRHEVKPRKPEWKFQMPLFGRRSISRMSSSCSRHFRRDLLPIQNISSPETQFTAR